MVQIAATIAGLLNKQSKAFNVAVCSITYRALAKGYSWSNIQFLGKQIAQETGWGRSNSINEDANAWGMNCVSVRENLQIGCRQTSNGEVLGQYDSIDASCADRLLWDDYWGIDAHKASAAYGAEVAAKYHTSSGYGDAVAAIDGGAIRTAMIVAVLVVPIEIFIAYKAFNLIVK